MWIIIRRAGRSFLSSFLHLEVFLNQNQMLNGSRLLFYYPFTALTVVFSHVIANPYLPTARNDIALTDVVTGLFGRLDFVSSGLMSCSESGEFTRLARATLERAILNHKGNLQGGYHKRNSVDLSSTPHASSSYGRKDSMTGSGMELSEGLGRTPLRSSNSFLGSLVEGAVPGTDINRVDGMEISLSSRNGVLQGVNALPADHANLEGLRQDYSVNENQHMSMGFDWASTDIDRWPDIGPDYLQANLLF
jgi:hypothetical protein